MAEYLGYVNPAETKANPTLDWSTVINDVRDTLAEQEAGREATRQKAKQETNELYNSLNKISAGQNQGLNGFITNASYQSKNLLGEAYKLYTSGKISGKDYTEIQNNMKGSFTDINDVVKTLQSDYEKYMDLSSKGQTSIIDDYNQKQKGEALDLSNKEFYVDPLTGRGYIGKIVNGKIDQSSLQPPAWIKTNGSTFVGKVDIPKEIAPYTKDLGKFEYILQKPPAGGIWTTDNIAEKPEFKKFLDDAASAIVSNPYKMATILGQVGDYNLVDDPKQASKENILMQRDSSTGMNKPMLTAEQEEEARNTVKNAILSQVNKTIRQEENTYRPPSGDSGGSGGDGQYNPPKGQFAYKVEIPANGKGAFIPMSGVNVKIGPKLENIPTWGIDSKGKLFVDVVTGTKKDSYSIGDGSIVGDTESKRYSENNLEFKKRLKYLINPNTGKRISNLAEAKSIFGGTNTNQSKNKYTEGQIQYLMKQNPGATREQIIKELNK
jgi:predicted DNA-binding ArsR family transcriptional regulator